MFVPPPEAVYEAFIDLIDTGQLQQGLLYSFLRITVASILSMIIAVPLALVIYGIPLIHDIVMPSVSILRYIPVTALSPLLILWFGIGEEMKLSFIFAATFVYVLPSIVKLYDDIEQKFLKNIDLSDVLKIVDNEGNVVKDLSGVMFTNEIGLVLDNSVSLGIRYEF